MSRRSQRQLAPFFWGGGGGGASHFDGLSGSSLRRFWLDVSSFAETGFVWFSLWSSGCFLIVM